MMVEIKTMEDLPKIIFSPDAVLKQKAQLVSVVDKKIRELVKVMRQVMVRNNGIGLAANQIGIPLSVFVAQYKGVFYAFINPRILRTSKAKTVMSEGQKQYLEGCLSLPGYWGIVPRHQTIVIAGLGVNGKKKKIKASGVLAHIFQHEIDHLEGRLFIEKAKEVFKADKRRVEHGSGTQRGFTADQF